MSIRFPNVPLNIAGLPAVLRNASNSQDAYETLQQADDETVTSLTPSPWGVFDDAGAPVLFADSVTSFEYGAEYRIADFPIERGSFETYNKVETPFGVRVVMAKGGSLADRRAFLTGVDILKGSLRLYTVVTPERTYLDVNVERVALNRSAETGAGMVQVELSLREVREKATIVYSQTQAEDPTAVATTASTTPPAVSPPSGRPATVKAPSSARRQNQGSVQPKQIALFTDFVNARIPGGQTVSNVAKLVKSPSGRQLYLYDRPVSR